MRIACLSCVCLFFCQSGPSYGQAVSNVRNTDDPVALGRLNEMVKCGDPQAVPIIRAWLMADSQRVTSKDMSPRVVPALDGMGRFGDRHLLDTVTAIYRRRDCADIVRNFAAMTLARIGTRNELKLLKEILWNPQLSIRSRCESAIALLKLEVPEAGEFLLTQYDLYRLEFRTANRQHLAPVRSALERLEDKPFLSALDQRLENEQNVKMQNNIRTLKERMSLNGLPLNELRRIAANPDWKTGMYRRYPIIKILGARGDLETIAFLDSLKPWQTDIKSYAKQVEGHNRIILPRLVKEATGMIRCRHWEVVARQIKQQPDLLKSSCATPPKPPVAVIEEKPSFEELVHRLREGSNFGVRYRTLTYISAKRPYPQKIVPHVMRLCKDPNYNIRSSAASTLGSLQNSLPDLETRFPDYIPQLIRMLDDQSPDDRHQLVRRFATQSLRNIGKAAKNAIPKLLKFAVNTEEYVATRTEAVSALWDIGDASPEVVAALVSLLDDQSRINVNYPTAGNTACYSLERLGADAKAAQPALIERLRHKDAQRRKAAAYALRTVAFGSTKAEDALFNLMDDQSVEVQESALASLEGINETYAFFFRNNVSSSEVRAKRQALLVEIGREPARKVRFARLLAAQLRLGNGHHPKRTSSVRMLVALDARDHLPVVRREFLQLEKKTVYLERGDLRLQLLRALAAWLSKKDAIPFLIAVDSDRDEAPQVRFRAAVLLCERGDDALSNAYLVKQHLPEAAKTKPLLSVAVLRMSLQDRQRFASDDEFDSLKPVSPDELARIQKGVQLAQHFFHYQQRGAIRSLSVTKVRVKQGKLDGIQFRLTAPSEGWSFELRYKGEWWLPCDYQMTDIE